MVTTAYHNACPVCLPSASTSARPPVLKALAGGLLILQQMQIFIAIESAFKMECHAAGRYLLLQIEQQLLTVLLGLQLLLPCAPSLQL